MIPSEEEGGGGGAFFPKESAFLGGVPHASKTPFLSVVSPLLMENGH